VSLRLQVTLAFLAVYLIWGSTYLAIRFAIESLPPFFMAGARFVVAGTILYALVKLRSGGSEKESKLHWGNAFVIGGLMLLGGHGAVVWAEQWVPSGLVSLLVGTVPLWMAFVDWMRGGSKPSAMVGGGLLLGFVGVALLAGGFESLGAGSVDLVGAAIVVFGAFLWANGSLYSRSAELPNSPLLSTAMEMFAGGVLLLVASVFAGEWSRIRLDLISARSMLSWIYLVVFGALVAFTCYIWLLKKVSTTRASTYAYVNPIVAMFLGWALANEPITIRNILAAAIILTSVIIITTCETRKKTMNNRRGRVVIRC
jgi:drug/metabolite transporter (DMT)-like permease